MARAPIKKVLVVDDDDDIRLIAEISLRDVGGFEVLTAASGRDGIEMAIGEMPDLILLDMMMPGMDGLRVLAELRSVESTKNIPVAFLTAKAQKQEIALYLASGGQAVITKPFDPMQLPDQVRRIGASFAAQAETDADAVQAETSKD